jgi:L,D-peptidoglycan transpeptidase YkuD (ErfK/YbiS/YcfS/YnhG family)
VVGHRPGRRRRRIFFLATVALTVATAASCAGSAASPTPGQLAAGTAESPPAASTNPAGPVAVPDGLPAGVPAPPAASKQLITVTAASSTSTDAVLQGWQRDGAGAWTRVIGPVTVRVGRQGIGVAHEGLDRTPAGTFGVPSAFGRAADPGTRMPYAQVGERDWWVSDVASPLYNTHRQCTPGGCPFNEQVSENLGRVGPSYDHAIVIGYNTSPVTPGAGSAFFLHVDAGIVSQGCVSVRRETVIALLRWLDPTAQPVITIGVR